MGNLFESLWSRCNESGQMEQFISDLDDMADWDPESDKLEVVQAIQNKDWKTFWNTAADYDFFDNKPWVVRVMDYMGKTSEIPDDFMGHSDDLSAATQEQIDKRTVALHVYQSHYMKPTTWLVTRLADDNEGYDLPGFATEAEAQKAAQELASKLDVPVFSDFAKAKAYQQSVIRKS